jgi:hypothetical protein
MNVPNRYKGFSKLPENVQQRMDPSLAKKYQMGGSVMQRPLFRQMGGPAQMMPQDMPPPPMGGAPMAPPPMPPPPMDPMAEQMMAAENMGQSAGEDVANAMMMQIDGAEDYESLIDGIRGNELPLDARYQELAGFVGEADAMATPESVLAMTQPTIMMTEQGAVDSGIGELMQGIAGEVDMSGPMDDGVGSLMAAGAGNTPPVNFRNGGPVEVRGFANGTPPTGNSSVIAQAQAMAPEYQKYFAGAMDSKARAADLEEQKRMSQAQMLFDIAGAGLAFAGETQGGTAAERLANALTRTQLTDKIGSRSAGILDAKRAQAAEDRQLRMASLQGALSQAQIDEKARQDLLIKQADSSTVKPISLSPGSQLVSSEGTLLATNSTTTPKTITLSAGQSVFDEEGVLIASMPAKPITYNLSPGQAAYDEKGNIIVERADKPQVINLAPGAIAYDGEGVEIARGADKPAVTHLLGQNQKLVSADGTVIAQGKETKQTVTLGPGQRVVNVNDGSVIAKGPAKFETISLFKLVEAEDGTRELKKQSINVGTDEGIKKAEELMKDGYLSDNNEANAYLNEQIAILAEDRELNRPYTRVINDQIVLINPAKPEEKPKVIFDASGLSSIFGNTTAGITMSIATDEALLEKYAANTLDPEVDDGVSNSTMEAALSAYTTPTSNNFDKSSKDFKITPALPLNNAQIRALRARKAAGFELPPNVYFPDNDTEAAALAILNEPRPQDVAPLGAFLTDDAWGSGAFLKTAANVMTEFIFLPAYFKDAKNATDAVKNLNQEFEQMLLESQGIRESVFQGKKIEVLTPNPANPFVGPESAESKSLILHLRLKDMITRFETQIGDELIFMDDTGKNSVSVKRSILPVLRQLSAGYQLLAKHDIASRGGDPSSIETYQRNQLIKKLDELSSKPKVETTP